MSVGNDFLKNLICIQPNFAANLRLKISSRNQEETYLSKMFVK